mmetsp:Transcript_102003/g.233622  ORF Transcript_102003/g.233622 Transcript_102003/m.233622 type:complete len:911 (+) Transcript_102003:21-2753(+)
MIVWWPLLRGDDDYEETRLDARHVSCSREQVVVTRKDGTALYSRWPPAHAGFELTPISTPHRVVVTSCGASHAMLVTELGEALALGSNDVGQCGFIRQVPSLRSPTLVPLGDFHCVGVACGRSHSLLLSVEGDVVSAGSDVDGQCGSGQCETVSPPQRVGIATIEGIAAGERHSLAVTRGGHVYCWGDNSAGQCGGVAPTPRLVEGLEDVRKVECSSDSTLSACLSASGSVWVWGASFWTSPTRLLSRAGPVVALACSSALLVACALDGRAWALDLSKRREWQLRTGGRKMLSVVGSGLAMIARLEDTPTGALLEDPTDRAASLAAQQQRNAQLRGELEEEEQCHERDVRSAEITIAELRSKLRMEAQELEALRSERAKLQGKLRDGFSSSLAWGSTALKQALVQAGSGVDCDHQREKSLELFATSVEDAERHTAVYKNALKDCRVTATGDGQLPALTAQMKDKAREMDELKRKVMAQQTRNDVALQASAEVEVQIVSVEQALAQAQADTEGWGLAGDDANLDIQSEKKLQEDLGSKLKHCGEDLEHLSAEISSHTRSAASTAAELCGAEELAAALEAENSDWHRQITTVQDELAALDRKQEQGMVSLRRTGMLLDASKEQVEALSDGRETQRKAALEAEEASLRAAYKAATSTATELRPLITELEAAMVRMEAENLEQAENMSKQGPKHLEAARRDLESAEAALEKEIDVWQLRGRTMGHRSADELGGAEAELLRLQEKQQEVWAEESSARREQQNLRSEIDRLRADVLAKEAELATIKFDSVQEEQRLQKELSLLKSIAVARQEVRSVTQTSPILGHATSWEHQSDWIGNGRHWSASASPLRSPTRGADHAGSREVSPTQILCNLAEAEEEVKLLAARLADASSKRHFFKGRIRCIRQLIDQAADTVG